MAYCLRRFLDTLDQILYPEKHNQKWVLDHEKIPQIQFLFENSSFLQDFLDKASPQIQERISSLEDKIMEAAEKATDILDTHITSQILSSTEGQSFTISPPDLSEVMHVFEVAKQEMDAGKQVDKIVLTPTSTCCPNSWNVVGVEEDLNQLISRRNVVGLEEDLNQLRSRLTSKRRELDIIPIVGMGGIGKTTLARILYDEFSPYRHSYFDYCAWVTVSQIYDPQQIFKTILACVTGNLSHEILQQRTVELMVTLHKNLIGTRYLIVLDDIWSSKAWDKVLMYLPSDDIGSRVVFTTRERLLVDHVHSNGHEMRLLNEDISWELLRSKVFGYHKSCPRQLEEIGKKIAKNCGGLPLALQTVGDLLLKTPISYDFWVHVAGNVSTILAEFSDQFSGIFSRSFTHLPHYLKPCFLYMSAFPDYHDIEASKIIKLWVAEGFLRPIEDESLEEAAQIYLDALVDSNLIFVHRRKKDRKAKSYGIHCVLRDLCLRKAREKKFLDILQDDKLCIRPVIVYSPIDNPEDYITLKFASRTHSYLLMGNSTEYKLGHCVFKPSLLHVLDVYQVKVNEFPEVILQLVNLRYLAIYTKPGEIPRSIYVLTNLQTLIVKYLVSSIALVLALPKLRHFELDDLIRTYESRHDTFIGPHESLQSLCNMPLDILAENLVGKLPKLRKLGIKCGYYNDNVDLTCFQELETLKVYHGFYLANGNFISNISFPNSLQKLTLYSCGVPESLLFVINVLPSIQVLKLDACIFMCPIWELIEGGFCQLKYLQISCVRNLKELLAESIHFPVLRHLVLQNCRALDAIPIDIGDNGFLEIIEVDECKPSVFDSARMILEEKNLFGDDLIQLRLGNAIDEE